MKGILDKTKDLVSVNFVNAQQFKLGSTGLCKGRRFVLLKGKQVAEFFQSGSRSIPVFKYRAAILGPDNKILCVDAINLSDLCRNTYGAVQRDEENNRLPYPEVGFTVSNNGTSIPASFGEEINCGWDVRKQFISKDGDRSLYDGIIDYEQAFEVDHLEFHWVSEFDTASWTTKRDENGNVAMKLRLIPILKRVDIPEGVMEQLKLNKLAS